MSGPVLQTQQIAYSYGSKRVLTSVDLCVQRGEVFGFLGRNGSGKTTTLKILLGILVPRQGQIDFLGQSVSRMTPALKQRIGYVSQAQHFYGWMTCKRLGSFVSGFYPDWSATEYSSLLDSLGISPKQRVRTLSGGTKMKLAVALALATQPEILILDEPTAGVDPIARREILDLLRHVAQTRGRTVLFSTHNIHEVEEIADTVGVLHQGELAYQGSVEGLLPHVRQQTGQPLPDANLEAAFVALVAGERLR